MNERLDDLNVSRRNLLRTVGTGFATIGLAGEATGRNPPGRYIVGTRSKEGVRAAKARANAVDRELDFGDIGFAVAGRFPQEALDALQSHPDVRYVEPDGRVEAVAEELPWGIDRVDAEVAHSAGETGSGSHVAILDTGIDADHPDLQANLGDGYAAETCDSGCSAAWGDDNDHGTHCAGIVGAVDNTDGTIGVATEATLHAVKVLGEYGSGTWSGVADGLSWVVERGYDVASMSFGAASSSSTLRDACQYAYDNGVLLVAATGNDGPCTDCVEYPAAYSTVIAVSAVGMDDDLSSFSSTGPEVELTAPGTYIYSTIVDGYQYYSGTSMACPHVAAAGGQLMAKGYTNTEARTRLQETAEDLGLSSSDQGYGLLDVEAAVGASDTTDTAVVVSTDTATDITETAATLGGTLTDLGGASSADVAFDHRKQGTTSWSTTATQTVSSTGSFTATLSGLESGTTYEYRATATASDGDTDTGSTVTLETTTDPSVVVSTDSATNVTETAATLDGTVSDLGGASSADVAFDYRKQDTTSWSTTATQTVSSTGTFSESLSGLESGVTYEYRAVATASDGDTDTGSTATLTTDAAASELSPPTVESYAVSEAGKRDPHAEMTADWTVADVDGDLATVVVDVLDSSGSVADSAQSSVGGDKASGSDSFKLKKVGSTTFEVQLTVTDASGRSAVRSEHVSS